MATVLLLRHGRTASNASGVLAGWTDGVALDDTGRAQARALGERLAALPLVGLVSSPLQRCVETAEEVLANRPAPARGRSPAALDMLVDDRLGECRYGDWTGQELKKLARDPLWKVVQSHPSGVTFPGADGESLRAVQGRAVDAVREHDARVESEHGPEAMWAACSHGDVIKAVVAEALGLHLDAFQRIVAEPCSVSVVRWTPLRPFVLRLNDTGSLESLAPAKRRRRGRRGSRADAADSDAVVGGGSGSV